MPKKNWKSVRVEGETHAKLVILKKKENAESLGEVIKNHCVEVAA